VCTPRLSSETAHPRSIICCSLRRARWRRILTVVRVNPRRSAISGAVKEWANPRLCAKRVEQRPAGLAFETQHPMLEPPLSSAIFSRRDCPYLVRTTELVERFTRER